MQVICIWAFDNVPRNEEIKAWPQVGDRDTVTNTVNVLGKMYYELQRFGTETLYRADHFATLPDTPAEVIEEEETELVTA